MGKRIGLFRLGLANRHSRNPLVLLCYHGLSSLDEHRWNPELFVTPELFRHRLQTIQRLGYQVLPLADALELQAEGALNAPTVALTFDDGWHDFYRFAWPVLKEFGYSATVYQTTYYTQNNYPVFDPAVSYMFWRALGRTITDPYVAGERHSVSLTSRAAALQAESAWLKRIGYKSLSGQQKQSALAKLAAALEFDWNGMLKSRQLHLMNNAEVAEVSRAGIDVQLHTHSHRMPLNKEAFLREINRNRYFIEMATGKRAVHFCYPNGWYRPELANWLAEAGVHTATTCDPGSVYKHTPRMYLPRMTDSTCVSDLRFESWLSGVGLIVPVLKRWITRNASSPSRSLGALEVLRQLPAETGHANADPARPEPVRAQAAGIGR